MRIRFALLAMLILCGCKSIEGMYGPGCVAYAGDTIELHDGRFTWNRFTDEVRVDSEHGDKIDPFPGFPKTRRIRPEHCTGDQVELHADGEAAAKTYTLLSRKGQIYLLTLPQAERYASEGVIEQCALVRDDAAKTET